MTKAISDDNTGARKATRAQLKAGRSTSSRTLKRIAANGPLVLRVPGAPDFGPHIEKLLKLGGITNTSHARAELISNLEDAWDSSREESNSKSKRTPPEFVKQLKDSIRKTRQLLARFERSHVPNIHFIWAPVGDEGTVSTATVRDLINGHGTLELPRNPPALVGPFEWVGA